MSLQAGEGAFQSCGARKQSWSTKPCSSRYSAGLETLRELFFTQGPASITGGREANQGLGFGQDRFAEQWRSWRYAAVVGWVSRGM